jgi:peptidyl-prolyl cis-trans isomerase SurA
MKDDYGRIQQVAFVEKQNKYLENWLNTKLSGFYIMLDDEYKSCDTMTKWVQASAKK